MKRLFASFALVILVLQSSQVLTENLLHLETLNTLTPLQEGQGYLLINLQAAGVAPSMTFRRLAVAEGKTYLRAHDSYRFKGRELTIELKNLEHGFYFLPLAQGLYQISSVQAPFYDLAYRLNTKFKRAWRFSILPGQTNYIGKLSIDKERGMNYVNIKFHNRIATDKTAIENTLNNFLTDYPLRSGVGFRDDFFDDFMAQEQ